MRTNHPHFHLPVFRFLGLLYLAVGGLIGSAVFAQADSVTAGRLLEADSEPQNWLAHGRTYSEQRFSPLDQINTETVGQLQLAWFHDLPDRRGQEATPLIVDGVLYTSSAWSKVRALDAITGELLWEYDPEVPGEWAVNVCCDVVNRGVAIWENSVLFGTLDGRLISLNADTGELQWETLTVDPNMPYSITGAPRVAKGKVFIGNGGAEFGVRGYISAYDIDTGELAWRFYTVPGNPADGFESEILAEVAKTWTGEWWRLGGGGTVWDSMAYDPELDLLYFGVGNGSPWNQKFRSPEGGDNLFLSSIVAVKPDTGEYVWHYQTTPGEEWDFTATQHMILADLEIDGQMRQVIMQVPKNGFFYVIDRLTGELISAEAVVPVNWASGIDMETGRPVETPNARYRLTETAQLLLPGPLGIHNWHPMSFHPQTQLVYVPVQEISFPYLSEQEMDVTNLRVNLGVDVSAAGLPADPEIKEQALATFRGHLAAWDPVAQEEVWRVQHAGPWNGGVLSTAGNLVFQGTAAGELAAYSADEGEKLWSFDAQTGVIAPPVTYSVGGEQYVTVVAGWGGIFPLLTGEVSHRSGKQINISRVLTFKLGGSAQLPEVEAVSSIVPEPPADVGDADQVVLGKSLFDPYCSSCHGSAAVGGGVIPDLRYSALLHGDGWYEVVLNGAFSEKGMVGFGEELSREDAAAVRAYVIQQANELYSQSNQQ